MRCVTSRCAASPSVVSGVTVMRLRITRLETMNFKSTLVYSDEHNTIVRTGRDIPMRAA